MSILNVILVVLGFSSPGSSDYSNAENPAKPWVGGDPKGG